MNSPKDLLPSDGQIETKKIVDNLVNLIEAARSRTAIYANSALVILYWNIGKLINQEILKSQRAEYGEKAIKHIAQELIEQYGSGFDRTNLFRMAKFSRLYTEQQISGSLAHQLSWTHVVKLIAIDDELKREFYVEMCCLERWSVRQLKQKMDSMLYERTAISKNPESEIAKELVRFKQGNRENPDLYLQDPYVLSFLKTRIISTEYDLEQAILNELQSFIQELGSDFCFVARQKRMSTEKNDRYLDLLFYHRTMKRLVAIELKMKAFQPRTCWANGMVLKMVG
jgi:predicted nuclease of restriction endonuclease-like (RecB) superfamily